jgi:hypothetical protein
MGNAKIMGQRKFPSLRNKCDKKAPLFLGKGGDRNCHK